MTDAELAARLVTALSVSPGTEDLQRIAEEALGVVDRPRLEAVAWRLYSTAWLEAMKVGGDTIEAKIGAAGRKIAQEAGSVEQLARRFDPWRSLMVDPAPQFQRGPDAVAEPPSC